MRFFIDGDQGHVIDGWVLPDNPLAASRVFVSADGRRLADIAATGIVSMPSESGGSASGQWRFQVNEENVPGLSELRSLEIHDADTNLLVYRRVRDADLCPRKIILINTGIHPETALQAALYPHFRQSYFGIGRFTEQILTNLFDTTSITSCLMSGSILLPRYEPHFIYGDVLTTMLIQDPFVEMASRMVWLQERAEMAADPIQSWRLGERAEAAVFTAEYDYEDPKSLKRFFRMLPEPAYRLLYNPLTRILATRFPDDRIFPANSIIAVELLSRIGIVGHREHFEAFAETVFDQLGIDAAVPVSPPIPAATLALADRLRGIRPVQDFLNFDMVMSEGVRKSIERSWSS